MGIGCQQNGHWAATNHLSGRVLVQPISSAAGRCAGRGCASIRQLTNGHRLSTKWALDSDQSFVRSWLVQPISSAAGRCAGRGCASIRQLTNDCDSSAYVCCMSEHSTFHYHRISAFFTVWHVTLLLIWMGRQMQTKYRMSWAWRRLLGNHTAPV